MRWQKPAETLLFLRKAVIELRTIALTTPHGSEELRRIAQKSKQMRTIWKGVRTPFSNGEA